MDPSSLSKSMSSKNDANALLASPDISEAATMRINSLVYQRMIESINAPVVIIGKNNVVTYWNVEMEVATRTKAVDAVGKTLEQLCSTNTIQWPVIKSQLDLLWSKSDYVVDSTDLPFIVKDKTDAAPIKMTLTSRGISETEDIFAMGKRQVVKQAITPEYDELLMNANAPIFGVDKQGNVNFWNIHIQKLTGHLSSTIKGTQFLDYLEPGKRSKVGKAINRAVRGQRSSSGIEVAIINTHGTRADIIVSFTSRYGSSGRGEAIGLLAIGQDITEKNAKEEEFRQLIDSANAPIFGINLEGCIDIFNKRAEDSLEYSFNDVEGKHLVNTLIATDYQALVRSVLDKALDGIETTNFEFPVITHSGRRLEILLNAAPRYDHLGKVRGAIGVGQDITDRVHKEEEYSTLINTANAPIVGLDRNGNINMWNRKIGEVVGCKATDAIGRNLVSEFVVPESRASVKRTLNESMNGNQIQDFECPLNSVSGRRLDIILNATPQYDHVGDIVGMVGIGQDVTEKRIQEEEYTRLIDKANAPIFGCDKNGCVNIWNQSLVEITQFTQVEALESNLVKDLIHPDHADTAAEVLAGAFKGVDKSQFTFVFRSKGGKKNHILLNATPRLDEKEDIVGVLAIGQDITERRMQEEEYFRLIDTANAPIFGVDTDMRVTVWNKKAADLSKYTTKEVEGRHLVETFISPDYRPKVREVISRALDGIETANFEFPLITRPGNKIEILLNATPRYDKHNNIVGVVGIGQDVTERIAKEKEYFKLIDTANAPIFGIDLNARVNVWNQKIEKLTGYARKNIENVPLVEMLVPQEHREAVQYHITQALNGVDVNEMELYIKTKSGELLLLLVNASGKLDSEGVLEGVIGVGQDYTAKKLMERTKTIFLASFSHELRTPLNAVLGMLELLRKAGFEEPHKARIKMAEDSGHLLLNLINDILDLSKIEAGKLELSNSVFHIDELLKYSVDLCSNDSNTKNLRLSLECEADVPRYVIGDLVRSRQVVLNLLMNAIKFTAEGGSITLKCSAHDVYRRKCTLLIEVIDTGIGIYENDTPRLFTLFTKLERSQKNNPTGSGLGLAICRQLVELMGGTIEVDSTLNEGSRFYFTIEVGIPPPTDALPSLCTATTGGEVMTGGRKLLYSGGDNLSLDTNLDVSVRPRILLVEDNDFNGEVVKAQLEEDDPLLQWERDGLDALNFFKENHEELDLILMDCAMPRMDGYEATRCIRHEEQRLGLDPIPIIAMTANAMTGDRQMCLDAGMSDVLFKPVKISDFREAIQRWLPVRYANGRRGKRNSSFAAGSSNMLPVSKQLGSAKADEEFNYRKLMRTSKRVAKSMFRTSGTHSASLTSKSGDSFLPYAPSSAATKTGSSSTEGVGSSKSDGGNKPSSKTTLIQPPPAPTPPAIKKQLHEPMSIKVPDGDPIDYTSGVKLCDGDEQLFLTFLKRFRATSDELLVKVKDCLAAKKFSDLRRHAHSLKGASGYAAAFRISKTAFRVQLAAENCVADESNVGHAKVLGNCVKALISEHTVFCEYFEKNITKGETTTLSNTSPPLPISVKEESSSFTDTDPMEIEIPDGDPVDYSAGLEICGNDEMKFVSLLQKFHTICEGMVNNMTESYASKDYSALVTHAHSLKGAAGNASALRLSKSAFRVQISAAKVRDGSGDDKILADCISLLEAEYKTLCGFIRRNVDFTILK